MQKKDEKGYVNPFLSNKKVGYAKYCVSQSIVFEFYFIIYQLKAWNVASTKIKE